MPKTLRHRFTYGNFADVPTLEPEFVVGVPARQREIVALAERQVALADDAAPYGGTSVLAAVIRQELASQSVALGNLIRQGTDKVVSAVDDLADRISAELVEIRWQLVQLRRSEEQIIEVLKRPLGTEAQELLQQGIRNLINDKLEQAEERFIRALYLDNTDYRVLMNLSAVAVRKNNPQQAIAYLKDALTLPADLDPGARAEALWTLARVYYAEADYKSAVKLSQESLALVSGPRRLLQYGSYLILAEEEEQGFSVLDAAIRSDPRLFGLAAISSDLTTKRDRLEKFLTELLNETLLPLRTLLDEGLVHQVAVLASNPMADVAPLIEAFVRQVDGLGVVIRQGDYTELLIALPHASKLYEAGENLLGLNSLEPYSKMISETDAERKARAVAAREEAQAAFEGQPEEPKEFRAHVAGLGFVGAVFGSGAVNLLGEEVFKVAHIPVSYFIFGAVFVPLILIVMAVVGQNRKIEKASNLKKAQEALYSIDAEFLARASRRDNAIRKVRIPEWPLPRWYLPVLQ